MEMKDFAHGGLKIMLTKDEENGMSGIEHVRFDKIDLQDVLVLDSDKLGNFEISGAGYSKLNISVITPFEVIPGLISGIKLGLTRQSFLPGLSIKFPRVCTVKTSSA